MSTGTKTCRKCGETKSRNSYTMDRTWDGLRSECKECVSARNRAQYASQKRAKERYEQYEQQQERQWYEQLKYKQERQRYEQEMQRYEQLKYEQERQRQINDGVI